MGSRRKVEKEFLERLRESREVSDEEEEALAEALDRVYDLHQYPFTALELAPDLDEEQVAIRINSKGVTLNQADFILTLMSVFWDEGRVALEAFSRASRTPSTEPSPFNYFIEPDPDQLLRVSVAVGFRRGRLRTVYSLLRGRDLESSEFSDDARGAQFARLEGAQAAVLKLSHWHDFMQCLIQAGYRSDKMISSQNALLYTYALYLIGLLDFSVERGVLRDVIARWFFVASLTGRYTAGPESAIESDLNRLRDVGDADGFVKLLDQAGSEAVTDDFWEITLPSDLATQSAKSPALFAYLASLCVLDAPVLFSKLRCETLLDPAIRGTRAAVERHHLFPRAYLESIGVSGLQQINQIANYALVEWWDNMAIAGAPPAEYWPEYFDRMLSPGADAARHFSTADVERMVKGHALPEDWQKMEYSAFLGERRQLMAGVVRDALSASREAATLTS